jgi:ATP-binding cassette subfamily G (WHITE) protein 2 (SNQ2)
LEKFDHMLLLKRGGSTVYFGPIGPQSRDLVGYFERNGAPKFPPNSNPADVMLGVLDPAAGKPAFDWAAERWAPSDESAELNRLLNDRAAGVVPSDIPPLAFAQSATATVLTQFRTLIQRESLATWRNPGTTIGLMCA